MSTVLRECPYCGQYKPYDPSAKKGTKARGFHGAHCWDCYKESARASVANYRSTPAGAAAKKVAIQKWLDKPGSRELETQRSLAWKKANPGTANANNARYRALMAQATPTWSETVEIAQLYREGARLDMHVDHMLPINSDWVCGLHVLCNLQLLPGPANVRKSNRRDSELLRSLGYHVD